jgi:hypothetical protein
MQLCRITERITDDDGPFESYKATLEVNKKIVAAMDLIAYQHGMHQASFEDIKLNMDDLSISHSEWYNGTLGFVFQSFFYIEDIRTFKKGKGYGATLLKLVTSYVSEKGFVIGGSLPDSNRDKYSDIGNLICFYELQGYDFQGPYFYKQPKLGAIL